MRRTRWEPLIGTTIVTFATATAEVRKFCRRALQIRRARLSPRQTSITSTRYGARTLSPRASAAFISSIVVTHSHRTSMPRARATKSRSDRDMVLIVGRSAL